MPANPWTDCEEMQLEPIVILIKQKAWGNNARFAPELADLGRVPSPLYTSSVTLSLE